MSGQPPSKDDQISPHTGAAGRSRNTTPAANENEEQRRNVIRALTGPALEAVARQPGMPERADYESQEDWLRALLTASLQVSDEAHVVLGHEESETNQEGDQNQDGDQNQGDQDQSESKSDES